MQLYFHIPVCASRCHYCAFYSTTRTDLLLPLADALMEEMQLRRNYCDDGRVSTLYFGGGTPSLLPPAQVARLIEAARSCFHVDSDAEITLEANPQDLTADHLRQLRDVGVNRLSLGIQSLNDTLLRALGRRHDAQTAVRAFHLARQAGFDNISVDLIYGIHGQTFEQLDSDVTALATLGAEHISAYGLSYEDGTPLHRQLTEHSITPLDDELVNRMYDHLCQQLSACGYEHYEVSNFALHVRRSRHNSGYWDHTPYLGLGPAAHSFNGHSRQWNTASLTRYLEAIARHTVDAEQEQLTTADLYNETVMLRLRTAEGLDLNSVSSRFGNTLADYCLRQAQPHIRSGLLTASPAVSPLSPSAYPTLRATREGLHLLNPITSDLFCTDSGLGGLQPTVEP